LKLNKESLRALCEKDDRELWESIRNIAKEHGYTLSEGAPSKEQLARVRSILSGEVKFSYGEAMRLLNEYKKGAK
jgi:hypothetical protein